MQKPSFTVADFAGVHNKDLQKTNARILKGGSWRKQRVCVIIPAADTIPAKVALSHWNLAFPPNNGVVRILAQGMEVGDAYSQAIENILNTPDLKDWEYILTIEHDNCPPSDGVIKLIEQMENHPELACIGGLYFTKGDGGCAQIWGDIKDPIVNYRPQAPDVNGGLVECYGTGMGFNLWRLGMFKDARIKKPWFRTLNGKDGLGVGTQDLTFWSEARKYGYRCAIDCSVKVGHYDLTGAFGIADTMY
jgi:hypothetical protein